MKSVALRASPRLHFGLIDLSHTTFRAYGGVGVAINGPGVEVKSSDSQTFHLDIGDLDGQIQLSVRRAMTNASTMGLAFRGNFNVTRRIPSHVGLGSTTATTLAILKSIAIINDWPLDHYDLISLSGRGRTSAVGSHSFFHGGLIADAGQPAHPTDHYLPSLAPGDRPPSLPLARWPMPDKWSAYLIFAAEQPSVPPDREAAFFAAETPTPAIDTLEQMAALYHGIIPAVLEQNLTGFAIALKHFQTRGFKAKEIAAQPPLIKSTLDVLWDSGSAAGLSSLGPTIFVIADEIAADLSKTVGEQVRVEGPFTFRNAGFEESHDLK